jgi:hypothetical protein
MRTALTLNFLLSITIAVPAIIGLLRYRFMQRQYHPLVWLCCLATGNELFKFYLLTQGISSNASYNIAIIFTAAFYVEAFWRWGLLQNPPYLSGLLLALLSAAWLADHFVLHGNQIHTRTMLFRVVLALTLVLLSIENLGRLVTVEKHSLLRHPQFIVCLIVLLYYSFRIITDVLLPHGSMSISFRLQLANIHRTLLQLLNLSFAFAMLWTPKKKNFTMLFS